MSGTQRDIELARVIADTHQLRPRRLDPVVGHGSVNRVFVAGGPGGRYVIRFAVDPRRPDEFQTEAWCLTQAAAHGIPSPCVVAVGVLHDVPYLVQTFVAGAPGTGAGLSGWRTLGGYASCTRSR